MIYILLSALIFNSNCDSLVNTILDRVSYRDTITNCIRAVKYTDSLHNNSICFTPYLSFTIKKLDSLEYSIELYPEYSGRVDGCEITLYKEIYRIKACSAIDDEFKFYKAYNEFILKKYEIEKEEFKKKAFQITGHHLALEISFCDIFDSLGSVCDISGFIDVDPVLESYRSGYIFKYEKYQIAFYTSRFTSNAFAIYRNDESLPETFHFRKYGRITAPLNSILIENCREEKLKIQEYLKRRQIVK